MSIMNENLKAKNELYKKSSKKKVYGYVKPIYYSRTYVIIYSIKTYKNSY